MLCGYQWKDGGLCSAGDPMLCGDAAKELSRSDSDRTGQGFASSRQDKRVGQGPDAVAVTGWALHSIVLLQDLDRS